MGRGSWSGRPLRPRRGESPIDTSGASWDDYQRRIASSADAWLAERRSPRAQEYWDDQDAWAREHARDADLIGWAILVGTRR